MWSVPFLFSDLTQPGASRLHGPRAEAGEAGGEPSSLRFLQPFSVRIRAVLQTRQHEASGTSSRAMGFL